MEKIFQLGRSGRPRGAGSNPALLPISVQAIPQSGKYPVYYRPNKPIAMLGGLVLKWVRHRTF